MEGWVKLPRSIVDEDWYRNPNARLVFLELLLRASFTDSDNGWKAGEIRISNQKLASLTGLSVRQVRYALDQILASPILSQRVAGNERVFKLGFCGDFTKELSQPVSPELAFIKECNNKNHMRVRERTRARGDSLEQKTNPSPKQTPVKKERFFLTETECFSLINKITTNQAVRDAACEWVKMRYAKRGEHRLTEKALRDAFAKIRNLGYNTESKAVACFGQSVEHLWDGLFELKEG